MEPTSGSPAKLWRSGVVVEELDMMHEPEPEPEPAPPKPVEWPAAFNLAACGCVGCLIADAEAPWILGCAPCGPSAAPKKGPEAQLMWLSSGGTELLLSGCLQLRPGPSPNSGGGASSGVQLALTAAADRRPGVLSIASQRATEPQVVFLSVVLSGDDASAAALRFTDRDGAELPLGTTRRNAQSCWQRTLTVIATIAPGEELQLTNVAASASAGELGQQLVAVISAVVFPFTQHPGLVGGGSLAPVQLTHFPLAPAATPSFCTQGVGGRLTHFFPESFHAVDLRCDDGTPLLAVGDGVVTNVEARKSASGISAGNLTEWNALTLALSAAGPGGEAVVIDYVHIRPGSALVPVGTRVRGGDPICLSGSVASTQRPPQLDDSADVSERESMPVAAGLLAGAASAP